MGAKISKTTTCRSEAQARKHRGMQKASAAAATWSARARAAIERLPPGRRFTAEDLRGRIRTPPPHANAWGPVLRNAAMVGLIVRDGYCQGERPESHARVISVWVRA